MSGWEFAKINLADTARRQNELDLLNKAGADGWELVCVSLNNIAYLKRPLGSAGHVEGAVSARRRRRAD